jgi:hypothetical protein
LCGYTDVGSRCPRETALDKSVAQRRIGEHPLKRFGKLGRRVRGDEEATAFMVDCLCHAAGITSDDWNSDRHRLDQHVRHPVLVAIRCLSAWKGENRRPLERGRDRNLSRAAEKHDALGQVELLGQVLERLAERPLPDQLTSEINAARREESERLEERVDSFLFDESCDAENDWHSLRLRVATAELASVDAVPDQDNLFPIAGCCDREQPLPANLGRRKRETRLRKLCAQERRGHRGEDVDAVTDEGEWASQEPRQSGTGRSGIGEVSMNDVCRRRYSSS